MVKKAHVLSLVSLCAFLLCSCDLLNFLKKPTEEPHQHTYVSVAAKDATFYEDGVKEHYICSGCNKTFDLNKNEKNPSEFSTKIPLFETFDRTEPISLKGQDISLTFDEEEVATNISEGVALKEKVVSKNATPNEIQIWKTKNENLNKSTATNYYYSDVLADFEATTAAYETKNKIYKAYNDLNDVYYSVFVEIAKDSTLKQIFFKSYTEEQLEEYIAKHTPSSGGGGGGAPSLSQQMETLLNNYKAGSIERYPAYSQYVALAKQLAEEKHKSSYLDYAYTFFDREYTVAEAEAFSSLVKTHIKPLYQQFSTKLTNANQVSSNIEGSNNLTNNFFGKNMNLLRKYGENLGEPYKTNFQKLFEEGHYFFSDQENKNVTAYTANSPALGRYILLTKKYQDMMSLVHEFGHYNAQEVFGSVSSLDLSEIQSNGNEILLLSFMKENSGIDENVVKTYTYKQLYNTTRSILLGCAVNEFEKFVYNNEFTQETMENKWSEILNEYGLSIGNKLDYLYQVVLNYRGYYISYAVSGVAALELYQKGITDFASAAQSYKSIYTKDSDNEKFELSLENAGLRSVFEASSYTSLSQLGNI